MLGPTRVHNPRDISIGSSVFAGFTIVRDRQTDRSPIYGCSLWCCVFQYSLNKLRVAYNDAFRLLLNEPRWCSASRLFVLHNVPSLLAIIRKSIYSLWRNLKNCDNSLVQALLLSDICMLSPLFNSWRNNIFSMFYVYITRLFIIVFHGLRAWY